MSRLGQHRFKTSAAVAKITQISCDIWTEWMNWAKLSFATLEKVEIFLRVVIRNVHIILCAMLWYTPFCAMNLADVYGHVPGCVCGVLAGHRPHPSPPLRSLTGSIKVSASNFFQLLYTVLNWSGFKQCGSHKLTTRPAQLINRKASLFRHWAQCFWVLIDVYTMG